MRGKLIRVDKFRSVPHRRFNPLTRQWILVSPQRAERPWQGKVEPPQPRPAVPYDPDCYLCPGNARASGARNPQYEATFVFENDYPAVVPNVPHEDRDDQDDQVDPRAAGQTGLIVARAEKGICLVGCFSPRHDLSIPEMSNDEVTKVVDLWTEQHSRLAAIPWIQHIQIFENRGALMGASNPHPHCQIWANATIPDEPAKEFQSFADYRRDNHSCLLCDYSQQELQLQERLVCENDAFAIFVPYWAVWPFEVLLISKRHCGAVTELSAAEKNSLAIIMKQLTSAYDKLFDTPFPYSMGFHQAATNQSSVPECHFHAHYYPPLLRSATVRKFMVGYELLASPQRDITPEWAAARLIDHIAPSDTSR